MVKNLRSSLIRASGGDNKICSFTFITLNLVWVLYKDIITLTEGETSK